jgi:adenylate kinase family enzyme
MRIHITGASGSGATTLGAALAQDLLLRHEDADSYYWLPTSPPFKEKRCATDRLEMACRALHSEQGVVLSGSIYGWGFQVEDAFDLVVFLYLPAAVRIERLRRREIERYGAADPAFLKWASEYDEGPSEGRSLAKHNAWLAQRTCPVLRLEQDQTVAERVVRVRQALPGSPARGAA